MKTPNEIKGHAADYTNDAWKQYTIQELGQWVHLLAKRAGHRTNAEKKAKDTADVVGNWVRLTLINYKTCPADKRPTDWTTHKVRFTELKRTAKDEGIDIKYDALRKALLGCGFEVGGRPGKGDECVKYAGIIPDEPEGNQFVEE